MERTSMIEVLYEDNHILVVLKPKGILSQADGTAKKDMLSLLKEYLKEKYHKPGNVYLGLVHRLDLFTSGIMVFAKTSKAASRLFMQVEQHVFQKKYLAIVEGILEGCQTITSRIKKNEKEKKSYIDPKGKLAILTYTVLSTSSDKSLLDIHLETGRFHQIRCQLASIGHPLYGDVKYGSSHKISSNDFPLEAYYLSFYHPITKELLTFEHKSLHL